MDDQLTTSERRALDQWTAMEPSSDFADRVLDARDAAPVDVELDMVHEARAAASGDRELDIVHAARATATGDRELDVGRGTRGARRRLARVAIVATCVAAAAVVVLIITRREPTDEPSTPVVEPAVRPPAPTPAPQPAPPIRVGIRAESAQSFEVRAPYATTWVAQAPGVRDIEPGSGLRFRAPATITAWDTTITVRSAASLQIDAPTNFHLEGGSIVVHARALVSARVAGGAVRLDGPGEAELVAMANETTIEAVFGSVRVVGKDREQALAIGDVVTLDPMGRIQVMRTSPTAIDVQLGVDRSVTIHDPRPPTAVRFSLGPVCPLGGVVELSKDGQIAYPLRSGGTSFASFRVTDGIWSYRVRCLANGVLGDPAKIGQITVVRDPATRALPTIGDTETISADGRNYRISYQSQVPSLSVRATGKGTRFTLHLAGNGVDELFGSPTSVIAVPGTRLRAGTYTYSIERDGVRDPKTSTLTIDFDASAPQLRLEPMDLTKQPIEVRGTALPGWQLSMDGIAVPVDAKGRFATRLDALATPARVLRAEHLQHGLHYYLRRPR